MGVLISRASFLSIYFLGNVGVTLDLSKSFSILRFGDTFILLHVSIYLSILSLRFYYFGAVPTLPNIESSESSTSSFEFSELCKYRLATFGAHGLLLENDLYHLTYSRFRCLAELTLKT